MTFSSSGCFSWYLFLYIKIMFISQYVLNIPFYTLSIDFPSTALTSHTLPRSPFLSLHSPDIFMSWFRCVITQHLQSGTYVGIARRGGHTTTTPYHLLSCTSLVFLELSCLVFVMVVTHIIICLVFYVPVANLSPKCPHGALRISLSRPKSINHLSATSFMETSFLPCQAVLGTLQIC